MALGFSMAFPLYKDEAPKIVAAETASAANDLALQVTQEETAAPTIKREILKSPLTGNLVALSDVPDEVFSSGVLGKGIAVEPTVDKVIAPADGEITTLFLTTRNF